MQLLDETRDYNMDRYAQMTNNIQNNEKIIFWYKIHVSCIMFHLHESYLSANIQN